ncbi:hypothetical protein EIP91_001761 [Steccherinum ochraceum]|uniref:FAD dependent oxidoreductase domain-containing protein n=1 Tax=Steccherinum ochraceum TaxID=92696 RepID=A0A4R0RLU2_9APHY|nr:hypothetical protein EIP91_001761 [Steccherinum ochraceum]
MRSGAGGPRPSEIGPRLKIPTLSYGDSLPSEHTRLCWTDDIAPQHNLLALPLPGPIEKFALCVRMSTAEVQNVIIIGAGIIGCTIAYYLTEDPAYKDSNIKITIIEASAKGCSQGASGKSGGLVAKWAYPKNLVNVSFPEHVRLAEKHNGAERWGWRFVGCGNWEGRGEDVGPDAEKQMEPERRRSLEKTVGLGDDWKKRSRADKGLPDDLDWVNEELTDSYSQMAPKGHTAQVQPYLFTRNMLELAKEQGAQFVPGKVTSINIDSNAKSVTGVTYTDIKTGQQETISATHVVLAAGPWSSKLIPALPINATRAHSITIIPEAGYSISPYVLFTDVTFPDESPLGNNSVSPEVYARPNNEWYCCGTGDNLDLPETVDQVEVDQSICENIYQQVVGISSKMRHGKVDRRQACYLPTISAGGDPVVGEATTLAKGLIIATGHTCWGISNAPGTGKAVAEQILHGKITCANLNNLSPARFL